jgi:hypothetical protein
MSTLGTGVWHRNPSSRGVEGVTQPSPLAPDLGLAPIRDDYSPDSAREAPKTAV